MIYGDDKYVGRVKAWAKGGTRETQGRRALRRRVGFPEVVERAEQLTGAVAGAWRGEHGGVTKPLILWAARRYAGLTLREIGEHLDGMDYNAVSMAIRRFEARAAQHPSLQKLMKRLEAKTCDV